MAAEALRRRRRRYILALTCLLAVAEREISGLGKNVTEKRLGRWDMGEYHEGHLGEK